MIHDHSQSSDIRAIRVSARSRADRSIDRTFDRHTNARESERANAYGARDARFIFESTLRGDSRERTNARANERRVKRESVSTTVRDDRLR